MSEARRLRIEFGDFQTPEELARQICKRLVELGARPRTIIEPTCGLGAFLLASAHAFPTAELLLGVEVNPSYFSDLSSRVATLSLPERVVIERGDFFETDWEAKLRGVSGPILVLGNFPWVTSATQGAIGGSNLPIKSNFQNHRGYDAITGKANFDISEWMLLEVMKWFSGRSGHLAMLCKTAVARKVLAHAHRNGIALKQAFLFGIDAKKHFSASVDASLLVMRFADPHEQPNYDYMVYANLDDHGGQRVGHRYGLTVSDLELFESHTFLLGESPQKWRSGIKHDASAVMEFIDTPDGLQNRLGEVVDLEPTYLYPLMKGSDVANGAAKVRRYALVTQKFVGEPTAEIAAVAPNTWAYLNAHRKELDARGSAIYKKNGDFGIFGVGDYTFKPWKIAVSSLYKALHFHVIGPYEGRPVVFDDTVYTLSFDDEDEARSTLVALQDSRARAFLLSLIFWDEMRPIKTSILNLLDWSRITPTLARQSRIDESSTSGALAGALPGA